MAKLVRIADFIRFSLERVAFASGWLLVALMVVTCVDVIGRKLGVDLPFTRFQELEWHLHTAIFALWMGYNYTINAHPRVDSYTEKLQSRRKAWIEFVCILVFALPFMGVVAWHSIDFVALSYWSSEQSESNIGLTHRWIIKTVYAVGLWFVLIAVLSVLMRLIAVLFGGITRDQAGLQIGHSELEV